MNTTLRSAMFAVSLSISLPAWADQAPANNESSAGAGDTIGTINFRADCSESVRADVDHALGMMHHMMYAQAQAEFEAIIQEDPGCAMAHWGVATSLFQPLWGTTPSAADITRGRQAIQEARNAVGDKRERLLIDATAAFFDTETDSVQERLAGWVDGMHSAYQAFPKDLEIATFYALSLLTKALSADDRKALHNEAEQVLRTAWKTQPTHPGAVHYSIHATDADGRGGNATEIVASYTQIAPNVPHALHMPSHIYVRLGDWPKMIDWNQQSAEVAAAISPRAIEPMRSAGELEATAEKHPVTPGALLPPYESLGDLLLALDRPEDALAAYENSNRTWPQRYNTLDGAARAANAAGDTESAALWARRLMEAAPGNERAFTAM